MNPLDWSGPEFLGVYVPALLVGFFVALGLRLRLRLPDGEPLASRGRLDPYELALLNDANGPVNAAVASLVHRKGLLLEDGKLRPGELPSDAAPFERAVHGAAVEGYTSLDSIRTQVEAHTERLREALGRQGLLVSGEHAFALRAQPALLYGLLLLLGLVKLGVGVSRDKPVGYLFFTLLVGGLGMLVFLMRPHRSQLGDATLAALKEDHQPLRTTVSSEGTLEAVGSRDVALAVGLFGASVLSLTSYQSLRQYLAVPASGTTGIGGGDSGGSSGSSCSSSSCSSSSGCSGGSSGCGGCGGGGGD
jgi:uncharacterized protein (TIGR04222 family)